MEQCIEEFFHDFRQKLLYSAKTDSDFQHTVFMENVARDLMETGFIQGFENCHNRTFCGIRIDGYWFDEDEDTLALFIADFDCRNELVTLTKTEVDAAFKRIRKFFEHSATKQLHQKMEFTSSEYDVAEKISKTWQSIRQVNFYLISERKLSAQVQSLNNDTILGIPSLYHIWDISRLYRQHSARGHKEPLNLDFKEIFGTSIACLPAYTGSQSYRSYLVVMPAQILAKLYDKHGARLLEQNVRCFLQARGNVNKGIRDTILKAPQMFFAYNNGITATALKVETETSSNGLSITHIHDLQIVNGGQTTASLYHTWRKDKADIENIFVQMKLSVIDSDESEQIVSNISRYANTQNSINAADFFSNHPFHIRLETYSRRLLVPAQQGSQRETHWFYERARGQYDDAQIGMTLAVKKLFSTENPKAQKFTKTDLAKFENVWDEHPRWVNLGAQKNFSQYALRIGEEWENHSEKFNDAYFHRIVARAIIFKTTEKLVSVQPWYNGGYRANIVAYTIAVISRVCKELQKSVNYRQIWDKQSVSPILQEVLMLVAEYVNKDITNPPQGTSNISEWAKKEQCWDRLQNNLDKIIKQLPDKFLVELIPLD